MPRRAVDERLVAILEHPGQRARRVVALDVLPAKERETLERTVFESTKTAGPRPPATRAPDPPLSEPAEPTL